MTTNSCDGGEAILEAFRALEIDYVVSSPGSEWGPAWEAFARQAAYNRSGPTYIDCAHESLAVSVAFGYTQYTGRMQAVLLHAGAGVLQGAMAIRSASLAEVPMLVMSGESLTYGEDPDFEPGLQWYRNLSVVGGPHRLVESFVKWSNQVTSVHTAYHMIIRAGEMAQRGPCGPTFLNIPVETMLAPWTPPERPRKVPAPPRTRPTDDDVADIVSLLTAAKNPIIITDTAGRDPAAYGALMAFADLTSIPVLDGRAATYANFPKDHPLYVGTNVGRFAKDADLALLVACRVPWYPPSNSPIDGKVVAISDHPLKEFMVYQNLAADIYLEGNVAQSLTLLTAALRAAGITPDTYAARARRWEGEHDKMMAQLRAAEAGAPQASPIDPTYLYAALREVVPSDAVYVDETVVHSNKLRQHLQWTRPQSYFKTPNGLGQGLGLALGVKLAAGERMVVLATGDGGFLYNPALAALNLSRDINLPILVLVFNNGQYLAMKENHLQYYPDGVAKNNELYYGVTINGPDYGAVAPLFGGIGFCVRDPGDLRAALHDAVDCVRAGRTAIVNVVLSAQSALEWAPKGTHKARTAPSPLPT